MSTKKINVSERVITRENVTEPKSSSITTEQRQNSDKSPQKNGPTSPSRHSITNGSGGNQKGESNPFEEEEWDEDVNDALIDNGEPGIPVRALYDYEGAESDELSFKQGDLFEKLEEEDEQGWCKGRKEGRVGLYPANYVEPVA